MYPKSNVLPHKCMHLSVNPDGLVSLWDTAEQARACGDEHYLCLMLEGWQLRYIEQAAVIASEKR